MQRTRGTTSQRCGDQFVIVSTVDSQCEDEATPALVLVNTTFHETVCDVSTLTVVLVVTLVAGDAAPVSVNTSAALRTAPEQVPPAWSVNDNVPFNAVPAGPAVTVPESFGSQSCADVVTDVMTVTVKHSFAPSSEAPA